MNMNKSIKLLILLTILLIPFKGVNAEIKSTENNYINGILATGDTPLLEYELKELIKDTSRTLEYYHIQISSSLNAGIITLDKAINIAEEGKVIDAPTASNFRLNSEAAKLFFNIETQEKLEEVKEKKETEEAKKEEALSYLELRNLYESKTVTNSEFLTEIIKSYEADKIKITDAITLVKGAGIISTFQAWHLRINKNKAKEFFSSSSHKTPDDFNKIDTGAEGENIYSNGEDIKNIGENFCEEENVMKLLTISGYVLMIAKLLVPIIIVIVGTFDYFKAVTADNDKEIAKQTKKLITRIVAGFLIFFIPTILKITFTFVSGFNDLEADYNKCAKCVLEPQTCVK